jgi:phenylalanyl-tRNA synthetase alpha chain
MTDDPDSASPEPAGDAVAERGGGDNDLVAEIGRIEDDARARVNAAATAEELRAVESDVLGKRSALTDLRRQLGGLDPDARRTVGKVLHEAGTALEAAVAERRAVLDAAARTEQLLDERLDLTEVLPGRPAGHLHLVTQAIQVLEDTFVGMGYTVAEGPEVETDWHNFGALNFPDDHPARDMYDTLYVNYGKPGTTLLRTHTSPVQVRVMSSTPPPYYTVMPGRVFRSDTADATHMPVFHQIEGLVVDRDITLSDLAGTIDAFTKAYFGGDFASRLRPSYFPFTEPSAEFDIRRPDGTWLELGGCGMVHPNVLRACGVDPEEWQGFAFGFGIDRLAAARHGVADLRDLFTNDIRFLTQF